MAEQGICGHDTAWPVNTGNESGRNSQLCLGFVVWTATIDRLLGQHNALFGQEGAQDMHRAPRGVKGQATALGLAVDGHPFATAGPLVSRGAGAEVATQSSGQLVGIEPAKEPPWRRNEMTMGPQRPTRTAERAAPRTAEPTTPADGNPTFRHSYSRDRAQLLRRLSRIEGQVRGIARMIEREEYCIDILQQTAALRAAVDAVSIMVLEDHVQGCVRTAAEQGEADRYVDEVLDVVRRTLGRPVRGASRA